MDDKEIHSWLFSAIQHHNESLLKELLESESGKELINLPDKEGNSLLHNAVIENDLNCVNCLLEHGANPNIFDTIRARTPLHLAVELGHTDIVKAFLELQHLDLNLQDDRNLTCYEIAQFCDNSQLAEILNIKQDELNQFKNDFYTIMNQACSTNDVRLVQELLEQQEKRIIEKLPHRYLTKYDESQYARSSLKELINWSSSSWSDVTLLFKCASKGYTEICKLLIDFGAIAKCNENTNYSPLYVAAYGGFTETVRLLLDNFPSSVLEITIEKWTVLHACCLQGHSETAKLILSYPYPEELKSSYVSRSGLYHYRYAFDLNAQDAAGQTAIYLSVTANNEKLLDTLIQFNVEATIINNHNNESSQQLSTLKNMTNLDKQNSTKTARVIPDISKPTVKIGGDGKVDKIIRQLCKLDLKDTKDSCSEVKSAEQRYLICPFEMDTYCDYNSKTALHLAVCQRYHSIATTLLVNSANPNLPILSRDSIKSDFSSSINATGLNWLRSSKSTCLKEACRLNDGLMCDILIRYGASDNQDNLALQVAASNKNNALISKFLSLKSNIDPEYKINRKCNVEFAARYKQNQKLSKSNVGNATTTFSSMFPSTPVMIDWQNLKCIRQIDPQWLIDASLMHNKRLKQPTTSLLSITRLDLSSNNLKTVHPVIFRLPSLRELNLSKNRLESLLDYTKRGSLDKDVPNPTSKLIESHRVAMQRSKSSNLSSVNLESSNIIDLNEPQEWDLPYLETLDLHDNRLISLPDCLFTLPRLTELDVSSNQIRQLPWSMWTAPSLKEMIASGNLLDDLPKIPSSSRLIDNFGLKTDSSNISNDEKSSLASNLSNSVDRVENSILSSTGSDSTRDALCILNLEVQAIQLESISLPINHLNHWKEKTDLIEVDTLTSKSNDKDDVDSSVAKSYKSYSKINHLNLSHNSFTSVPKVLACIALELGRLNLSHNRISSLGEVSQYPTKLKSIDLSNNKVTTWFVSPQTVVECGQCYAPSSGRDTPVSKFLYGSTYCIHKLHQRLDGLRSLNLSRNELIDIQLSLPTDLNISSHSSSSIASNRSDTGKNSKLKSSLVYPNLTTLDISFNRIHQVPKMMNQLKDLSVLNLNGNLAITSLPAELGLLSKIWNLGINGCNLHEPLKSIVESKNYKTIDLIGYLRSILDESKAYARMKLMLVGLQGIGKTSLLEQMRHEGSVGSRRKAPEHWTKRMGHASRSNLRNQRGVTLSTVGVDIHDWIFCKRTPRNQQNLGPVSFSTWDFGGQQEFYATHRYFLSKRSMYLVVWRLTDGLEGILGIQQWLVNIQSRASGSPVVIVGTHEDLIDGGEKGQTVQNLQEEVHKRFINVSDSDKCGLPNVMDSIVVSTKTKLNIKHLCNRIYDIVFSLRCPGSSERLLDQKIPATYLYLEEIVSWINQDRQQKKRDPVLTYQEYRRLTSDQLKLKYNKSFRDLEPLDSREINYNSELQQATRFLHENGIILHYEDANLRDLYFLDPQWLCDILSHVVTIREINPHVKNGLMKMDDLKYLFKSMDLNLSGGIQSYVVNLLNKFEVALTWNSQYLLIPSLLLSDPRAIENQDNFHVKLAPRMRGRSAMRKPEHDRILKRPTSIDITKVDAKNHKLLFNIENQPGKTIHRLILLRYLPAGFFARLQSGILSDPNYDDVCTDLQHSFLLNVENNVDLKKSLGSHAGWTCWKSGIKLVLQHESTINSKADIGIPIPLLTIQEFSTLDKDSPLYRRKFKVEHGQDESGSKSNKSKSRSISKDNSNNWLDLDLSVYTNIISVSVVGWRLKMLTDDGLEHFISPDSQMIAKLLAQTIDHIDNLLEDWYPSLGARFARTLGGSYLVSRIIPCPKCLIDLGNKDERTTRLDNRGGRSTGRRPNFSIFAASEPKTIINSQQVETRGDEIFCYYVEHCILNAYNIDNSSTMESNQLKYSTGNPQNPLLRRTRSQNLYCKRHGSILFSSVAPDIVFDDVPDCHKIENDQIERCKLIGRGTFGFVFKGNIRSKFPLNQLAQSDQEVALKLLQPVDPGPDAGQTDTIAFRSVLSNWNREPFLCACKSYCTARHEVNILLSMRHPNIVLFIGICLRPLAIALELAPLGCLSDIFKSYKRSGMRIDECSIQTSLLQVAKALEYLHQQKIIYRDLKSENVLVWSFPSPFATQPQNATVELKLADYGISRQAMSTGIWKGFAGTINFLAPEILRHNGDEEYTEKVDCFSFGVFMYELLTLRSPFKQHEVIKSHLAEGGRPTLTFRDLVYPNHMIDLMSACWSQEPHQRPTASQIVSIVGTPEFMQLLDVVALESQNQVNYCNAIQYTENNQCNLDFWLGRGSSKTEILSTYNNYWVGYNRLEGSQDNPDFMGMQATCMCVVDNKIWLCDSRSMIHVLPLGFRLTNQVGNDLKHGFGSKVNDETLNQVQSFPLHLPDTKKHPITFIKQMLHVETSNSVVMLSNNGQLWICQLDSIVCKQLDDSSIKFTCFAIQEQTVKQSTINETSSNIRSFQIYCGQSNGISCLEVQNDKVNRQSILPLASRLVDLSGERIVEPSQSTDVTSIVASRKLLWTSAGCTVHLWSLDDKCVARKLDCWKLVPCSESLESINIEEYYQQARSSVVSSMVYSANQLFVGTSHGCFIVIEADSLKPIIVFRPYESNITIISPTVIGENTEDSEARYLVTIGAGYRDLMGRYVNSLIGSGFNDNDVAILWSADFSKL